MKGAIKVKYVLTSILSDLASDVLLNATEYIDNHHKCFDASRPDVDLIRYNSDFRSMVNGLLAESNIKWDVNSKEMCADFVWDLYLQWADGLC